MRSPLDDGPSLDPLCRTGRGSCSAPPARCRTGASGPSFVNTPGHSALLGLEGCRHELDFPASDAVAGRHRAPVPCPALDVGDPPSGFAHGAQAEREGNGHGDVDVRVDHGTVDGSREAPHVLGVGVHVVGGRQVPSRPATEEAVVPQVVVGIGGQDREDQPADQLLAGALVRRSRGLARVVPRSWYTWMMFGEVMWTEDSEAHIGRHNVTPLEVEQVLYSQPRLAVAGRDDATEVLGTTDAGRLLLVVVTEATDGRDFVVTARDMTANEKRVFRDRSD